MAVLAITAGVHRLRLTSASFLPCLKVHQSFSNGSNAASLDEAMKRPLNPYIKFITDSDKAGNVPRFSNVKERSLFFSQKWKELNEQEKEKYKTAAAQARQEHQERMAQPELQKQAALRLEQKRLRSFELQRQLLKLERKKNHMPSNPPSGFSLYVKDFLKKGEAGDLSIAERFSLMSRNWAQMPAEERQQYMGESARQRVQYAADKAAWTARMEAEGKAHLIPGHEPSRKNPARSPFARAVMTAVESSTQENLPQKEKTALKAFIFEQLAGIKDGSLAAAPELIQDMARQWCELPPSQKQAYEAPVKELKTKKVADSSSPPGSGEDLQQDKVVKQAKSSAKKAAKPTGIGKAKRGAKQEKATELSSVSTDEGQNKGSAASGKAAAGANGKEPTPVAAASSQQRAALGDGAAALSKQKTTRRPADPKATSSGSDTD